MTAPHPPRRRKRPPKALYIVIEPGYSFHWAWSLMRAADNDCAQRTGSVVHRYILAPPRKAKAKRTRKAEKKGKRT